MIHPRAIFILFLATLTQTLLSGCGRSASSLLRQGQLPVYDFPLYLTEGATGRVWKYERDRSRTLLADGLDNPAGIATDRYNNVFVVEKGAGRLLRFAAAGGAATVVAENLQEPSVVAVNSFGEAFVAQDTTTNVVRAADGRVFGTYATRPSALTFGVGDRMIVGFLDTGAVHWGAETSSASTTVSQPVNAGIDSTGRVYVVEGSITGARVLRYHQDSPAGEVAVATNLEGPQGLAVDPVGNLYVVETGAMRIVLVAHDGTLFVWTSGLTDPQYIAFTQY